MAESKQFISNVLPKDYGCEILLQNTTIEIANNPNFPNTAYLVWYIVDGVEQIDLTMCNKKVDLFDFYYDKYGPGSIQKIDWGYGRVNPKLWGYVKKEKKENSKKK